MSDALLEGVASRFRALAEPARLRILQQLLDGERSVNDLTDATKLSQANTSKHLATLHAAGFLERRKEGTTVYHSISDPVVHELCDLMCARITAQAKAGARAVNLRRA
ncbi:MAG: helix-turn-helix transcriptional regulator [Planctomycetes bacterium]|nr:helix-turn-helix transcriptional regulator [Planctomycetota bacterium]